MATILSAWVVVLIPVNRGFVFRTRTGFSIHAGAIIATYFITGILAGALAGALRKLLRWRLGAALVGVFAAIPLGLGTIMGQVGPTLWTRAEILTVVFFPFLFGVPMGIVLRAFVLHEEKRKRRSPAPASKSP